MPKDLTELKDLKTHEVSLVDKGANKKKRFPIFKQESQMKDDIMKAVLNTEVEGEADLQEFIKKSELDENGTQAVTGALRILSSFKDKLPTDTLSTLATVAGYDEPVAKAKEPVPPKEEDKEDEEEMEMKKSLEGMPEEVQKRFEEITKSHEEITKAQADKIESLEKSLKAEQDRRDLESWVTKAKEELSGIPNKTPAELGETLKKLADVDKDLAESQFKTLKEAADTIKQGALFKEIGGRGMDVAGSAMEKVNKKAQALIEKSEGLTKEQAIAKVLESDSTLYAQYNEENPAQSGRN